MSSDYNVRHPESRRRIAEQCVLHLRPSATTEQRTRIADHILLLCNYKIVTEERVTPNLLSEDRLLDAVYNILQINRALLKDGHLEHEDHKAYFTQHVAILKELMGREKVIEPGGIAQSPDGKLWRVVEVDNEKVILKKVRGWKQIRITWQEWSRRWELKFP